MPTLGMGIEAWVLLIHTVEFAIAFQFSLMSFKAIIKLLKELLVLLLHVSFGFIGGILLRLDWG